MGGKRGLRRHNVSDSEDGVKVVEERTGFCWEHVLVFNEVLDG
jgi:hypothetical protein